MRQQKFFPILVMVVIVVGLVVSAGSTQRVSAFGPVQTTKAAGIGEDDLAFLSRLLQAILLAVLPVAAGAVANWAIKAAKTEAGKLDQQTFMTLMWLVDMAVKAAEQAKLSGYISNKKQYALEFCQEWLDGHGVSMDVTTIEAAIEAAVLEQFNKTKVVEALKTETVKPSAI